jgi:hypothetical protein
MTINRITINGQQYDSLEAMPPDVRRMYDEAMRMAGPSPASGLSGGNTQVFTGQAGGIGGSVVVNRIITANNRTYGSIDELPPDVRQLYEDALKSADPQATTTHPKTSLHVSVNLGRPRVRTLDDSSLTPAPPPFDRSSTESRLRNLPMSLAITIIIGLVLWALLGR